MTPLIGKNENQPLVLEEVSIRSHLIATVQQAFFPYIEIQNNNRLNSFSKYALNFYLRQIEVLNQKGEFQSYHEKNIIERIKESVSSIEKNLELESSEKRAAEVFLEEASFLRDEIFKKESDWNSVGLFLIKYFEGEEKSAAFGSLKMYRQQLDEMVKVSVEDKDLPGQITKCMELARSLRHHILTILQEQPIEFLDRLQQENPSLEGKFFKELHELVLCYKKINEYERIRDEEGLFREQSESLKMHYLFLINDNYTLKVEENLHKIGDAYMHFEIAQKIMLKKLEEGNFFRATEFIERVETRQAYVTLHRQTGLLMSLFDKIVKKTPPSI